MTTATSAKCRPIIFTADSVRAILDGRRTQMRLVVKPQQTEIIAHREGGWAGYEHLESPWLGIRCPHGHLGDLLWVRETWVSSTTIPVSTSNRRTTIAHYKADGLKVPLWRSPMHMPRWASRITLRITAVRVERVQEISEHDAMAEGVDGPGGFIGSKKVFYPRIEFISVWDSLNAKRGYSWESNPWVWVICFERAETLP